MRKKERPFQGVLGNTSELRVLEHLISLPRFDFNITELARAARLSRPAADKVVKNFTEWGIVTALQKRGNMTFYKLDEGSPLVTTFLAFDDMIAERMYPGIGAEAHDARQGARRRTIEKGANANTGTVRGPAGVTSGPEMPVPGTAFRALAAPARSAHASAKVPRRVSPRPSAPR